MTSLRAFFLFFLCVSATFCWIFLRSWVVPRFEVSGRRRQTGGGGSPVSTLAKVSKPSNGKDTSSRAEALGCGNVLFLILGMA